MHCWIMWIKFTYNIIHINYLNGQYTLTFITINFECFFLLVAVLLSIQFWIAIIEYLNVVRHIAHENYSNTPNNNLTILFIKLDKRITMVDTTNINGKCSKCLNCSLKISCKNMMKYYLVQHLAKTNLTYVYVCVLHIKFPWFFTSSSSSISILFISMPWYRISLFYPYI